MLHLLVVVATLAAAKRSRAVSPADFDKFEVWPQREPTKREASDSGVTLEAARSMPWFPTHSTRCGDRPCRPGEGNLRGYRFWGQPYIHREDYVQSRIRRAPHPADPHAAYAGLCDVARRVHRGRVVLMAAGDWDFREVVHNWLWHAHRFHYTNALVLSMDAELHDELRRRGQPSFDDSANLAEWNITCLQRHIQQVRMERVLALAALVADGFDVLATDATVVFVRDVLPLLVGAPPDIDILAQRDSAPPDVLAHTGSGVNAGLIFVRGASSPKRYSTRMLEPAPRPARRPSPSVAAPLPTARERPTRVSMACAAGRALPSCSQRTSCAAAWSSFTCAGTTSSTILGSRTSSTATIFRSPPTDAQTRRRPST
jgi:hypothetical protein